MIQTLEEIVIELPREMSTLEVENFIKSLVGELKFCHITYNKNECKSIFHNEKGIDDSSGPVEIQGIIMKISDGPYIPPVHFELSHNPAMSRIPSFGYMLLRPIRKEHESKEFNPQELTLVDSIKEYAKKIRNVAPG